MSLSPSNSPIPERILSNRTGDKTSLARHRRSMPQSPVYLAGSLAATRPGYENMLAGLA